jgi:hypothetical protein
MLCDVLQTPVEDVRDCRWLYRHDTRQQLSVNTRMCLELELDIGLEEDVRSNLQAMHAALTRVGPSFVVFMRYQPHLA